VSGQHRRDRALAVGGPAGGRIDDVVTVLGLVGVLVVLFATAVLATRSDPLLADAPPDRPDLDLPDGSLPADAVADVRFSLAVRGYRMSEVDAVLARLADELAERDRRIEQLQQDGPRAGRAARAAGPAPPA
jgi:DivIVA domain-containing protein